MSRSNRMRTIVRVLGVGACGFGLAFGAATGPAKPAPPEVRFPLHVEAKIEYDGEIAGASGLAGDRVVFATSAGMIYAVDTAQKAVAWSFAAGAPLSGVWALSSETIIALDVDGRLLSVSADGFLRWARELREKPSGDLGLFEGKVFFVAGDGELTLIDPNTGANAWGYHLSEALTGAVILPGRGFALASPGRVLTILHPSGQSVGEVALAAPIAGPLYAEDGALYVSLEDNTFRRLDARSLAWRWSVKTGRPIAALPVSDDERIYFVTKNNVLYAVNKKNGETAWWQSIAGRAVFSPALSGGQIFMASRSSRLTAFNKETGQASGSFDAGGVLQVSPVCAGPLILVHTFDPALSKSACLILAGETPKDTATKKK
jgi:outer membrane protein assembly factor BamB